MKLDFRVAGGSRGNGESGWPGNYGTQVPRRIHDALRFHSVTRYLLLGSLLVPGSSLAATPLSILWDDTHDGVELTNDETGVGGNYNDFRLLVEAEGHVLDEFDGPGDLTADLLADYDVLMFFDTEIDFTAEEVATIQEWVSNGGLLFVAGER